MTDKKAIAILALVVSLPIMSTVAAININPALALNINKNEKITQQNLCTNRALCQNRYSQTPRNSLDQHPSSSWSLPSTSTSVTPSLGKITTPGITMSDVSNTDPSTSGSVIATIPVGKNPRGIAFDSENGSVYVDNFGNNTVSVISGQAGEIIGSPIAVMPRPIGIAFDSENGNLYVTNNLMSGTVSVISGQTNTVIATISVGFGPVGIAFDSSNGNLYVAEQDDSVKVISGRNNTLIASIPVREFPSGIAFDSSNGNLYVTNSGDNSVSVISGQTNTVIGSPIPVGSNPEGITFDPANGNLYVTNLGGTSDIVSVISGQTNTVVGSISVGMGPLGIVYDPANNNLYVANSDNDSVSVISGQTNTLVGSPIPVPTDVGFITFDFFNNNLYVTDDGGFVSVIATTSSQQAPNTAISSAVDGNGDTVQNNGTTLSTSIHITFTGQPGTSPISSFLCSLDGSKFSSCTSPFVASDQAVGKQYTFQVTAVDILGNKDPTPAQFSWTVLTPAQGVEQLIKLIKSMGLAHGVQSALIAHLNAALQLLSHKQSKGACIQLDGFTKQVQVEVRVHQLNTANALQLIQSAQAIENALGCKQ